MRGRKVTVELTGWRDTSVSALWLLFAIYVLFVHEPGQPSLYRALIHFLTR